VAAGGVAAGEQRWGGMEKALFLISGILSLLTFSFVSS
jgi:hypothetical protein